MPRATDGSKHIHADDYRGPRPHPPHLENVEVAIHDGDVGDTDRAQINGRSNFHLAGSHIDSCSIKPASLPAGGAPRRHPFNASRSAILPIVRSEPVSMIA